MPRFDVEKFEEESTRSVQETDAGSAAGSGVVSVTCFELSVFWIQNGVLEHCQSELSVSNITPIPISVLAIGQLLFCKALQCLIIPRQIHFDKFSEIAFGSCCSLKTI